MPRSFSMAIWTIQQWGSLISILVVAITAIAFCAKISYRVEDLKVKVKEMDEACNKHRGDNSLHRGPDFERWLEERLDTVDDKLDDIRNTVHRKNT